MCGTAGISMFSSIPKKRALGQTPCMTLCISALFPHRSFTGFFAFTNFPLHPLIFVEATCAQLRNYTANQRRVSPLLRFNALKATQQWTNTLETRVKWRFTCKIPMSWGDFAALHVSNWDSKIGQIFAAVPSWFWPLVQHNESAARKMEIHNNERIEQHGAKHRKTWNINRMKKNNKMALHFFFVIQSIVFLRSEFSDCFGSCNIVDERLNLVGYRYACCDWMTITETLTHMITSKDWLYSDDVNPKTQRWSKTCLVKSLMIFMTHDHFADFDTPMLQFSVVVSIFFACKMPKVAYRRYPFVEH